MKSFNRREKLHHSHLENTVYIVKLLQALTCNFVLDPGKEAKQLADAHILDIDSNIYYTM